MILDSHVLSILGLYRQSLWMKLYGHMCLKRTLLWSTSPWIRTFDLGKIQKSKHRSLLKTAEKYRDRNGVLRYKGSRNLKGTEFPGWIKLRSLPFNLWNSHLWSPWGFIRQPSLPRSWRTRTASWKHGQKSLRWVKKIRGYERLFFCLIKTISYTPSGLGVCLTSVPWSIRCPLGLKFHWIGLAAWKINL